MNTVQDRLWHLAPAPIRFFLKHSTEAFRTAGGTFKDPADVRRIIASTPEFDVYISINRSRPVPVKAASADIREWNNVLIDIDPISSSCGREGVLSDANLVHKGLTSIYPAAFEATSIIYSGRGAQLWLRISDLPVTQPALIEGAIKGFLRHLAASVSLEYTRIDFSCSDLSRVARCPGTVNHKTGQLADIILLGSATIPSEVIMVYQTEEVSAPHVVGDIGVTEILPFISERAAQFITEGIWYPGRHSAAYATARSLIEAGVSLARVESLVSRGGSLCTPILSSNDCLHVVRSANRRKA